MAKGNILGIKNMVAATNSVVDLFCRKFCKTCERKKHTGLMKFQSELWISVGKMLKRERIDVYWSKVGDPSNNNVLLFI